MTRKKLNEALAEAARSGDAGKVKTLVAEGAQVDYTGPGGLQPLHFAASGGHKEVVEFLMARGAQAGCHPLTLAAWNGHKDIVELLIARIAPGEIAEAGFHALLYATMGDHREVVELLIAKGAQINAAKNWGWGPLHYAARDRRTEVMKLLLEKGAKTETVGGDGVQPLHLAAMWNYRAGMDLLLGHGADPTVPDKEGKTPRDLCHNKEAGELLEKAERKWNNPAARKKRDLAAIRARLRKLGALRPKGPSI